MIERRWSSQNPPLMDTPGTARISDTHQFEGGIVRSLVFTSTALL